jgi:hypothetical protein
VFVELFFCFCCVMSLSRVELSRDLVWVFFVAGVAERCDWLTIDEVWDFAYHLSRQLSNNGGLTARQLMLNSAHHNFMLSAPIFRRHGEAARLVDIVRATLHAMAEKERRRVEQANAVARAAGGGLGVRTPAETEMVRDLGTGQPVRSFVVGSSTGTVDMIETSGAPERVTFGQRMPINWYECTATDDAGKEPDEDGGTKRSGAQSGKVIDDDDDMRCGARYYRCADGKKLITTDTDGITKRIAELQHILRMMPLERRTILLETGLRLNVEHIKSRLEEAYMQYATEGKCPEMWISVGKLDTLRDLPAFKDDKKFEIFLRARWDWRDVRSLSLRDFSPSKTPWRVWEKTQCTNQGLQYLITAMKHALLMIEIVFGVPCAGIGGDLIEMFESRLVMLGTNDAFNFHQVNHAFSVEFRDMRTLVLAPDVRDDPDLRLYGPDAFKRRLAARFSEVVTKIPTGTATTVIVENFNTVTYPRITWHVSDKRDREGADKDGESDHESEEHDNDKKKKRKRRNKRKDKDAKTDESKPPAVAAGGGANGSNKGQDRRNEKTENLCLFQVAKLLQVERDGKVIDCSRNPCSFHHPRSLKECTRDAVQAAIKDKSIFSPEVTQRFTQAVTAAPAESFKQG